MSSISREKKQRVLSRFKRCPGCGRTKKQLHSIRLTVDHIIPKARGGTDAYYNLQAMCFPCNQKKGSKDPQKWHNETKMPSYQEPRY